MRSLRRRSFLGLAVGACAASAVHAAGAAGPAGATALLGPAPARLKKSLKIGMVGLEGSLEQKFRALLELGFDGVELDSPSDLEPEEVLAAKAATGIEIPGVVDSVHWSSTLGDADAEVRARGRAGLETALRDCHRFGGTTVLLVPAVVNAAISYDQAYRNSQAEIREVLPLARELDVKIAFENVWNNFLLSPLEAARYVDEFESDRVGWYMDVGNVVRYGWPEQWIRVLGPRVLKLDVKEYSREKQMAEGPWKGFGVKLGDGDCNWPAVMEALGEIGYEGWASAEVGGGDRERLLEISERMDRILVR